MGFFGTTFGEDNRTPEEKLRDEALKGAEEAKVILVRALKVLEECKRIDREVWAAMHTEIDRLDRTIASLEDANATLQDDALRWRSIKEIVALFGERLRTTSEG